MSTSTHWQPSPAARLTSFTCIFLRLIHLRFGIAEQTNSRREDHISIRWIIPIGCWGKCSTSLHRSRDGQLQHWSSRAIIRGAHKCGGRCRDGAAKTNASRREENGIPVLCFSSTLLANKVPRQ